MLTYCPSKNSIRRPVISSDSLMSVENRRYIGGKSKLKDWIFSLIEKNCQGKIFADIFAGTGVIAAEASKRFDHIILNDFLYSNYFVYQAFFGSGKYSERKISRFIDKYNRVQPDSLRDNYFSVHFSGKYFSRGNAKLIGFIREDLEKNKARLTGKEYAILLTSLLYAADKIANTVGHYDAYIKKDISERKLILKKTRPLDPGKVSIYREDVNFLAGKIKADIVYIDPPYNSRQYSRFYHLLETLVKWNKGNLHGVALKPELENLSEYCTVRAPKVFADLITRLKCKYIVVSYNNTYHSRSSSSKNKITLEQIEETLLKKGRTTVHKKGHKFFNSGKTAFDNHQEYLFITKVHD